MINWSINNDADGGFSASCPFPLAFGGKVDENQLTGLRFWEGILCSIVASTHWFQRNTSTICCCERPVGWTTRFVQSEGTKGKCASNIRSPSNSNEDFSKIDLLMQRIQQSCDSECHIPWLTAELSVDYRPVESISNEIQTQNVMIVSPTSWLHYHSVCIPCSLRRGSPGWSLKFYWRTGVDLSKKKQLPRLLFQL